IPAYNDTEQPKTKSNDEFVKRRDHVASQYPVLKQRQAEELQTPVGITDPINQNKQDDLAGEKKITASVTENEIDENNIQNSPAEILQDSIINISDQKLSEKVTDSAMLVKDTAKVVQIVKDPRSKWIWGIHVAAGVSR